MDTKELKMIPEAHIMFYWTILIHRKASGSEDKQHINKHAINSDWVGTDRFPPPGRYVIYYRLTTSPTLSTPGLLSYELAE